MSKETVIVIQGGVIGILVGILILFYLNQSKVVAKLECPFEAGECPNPRCSQNTCREYQFDLEADSTVIYEGNRLVGILPYDSTQALDKLMIEDNR